MTIASDDTARTAAVVTGTVDFIEYAPLRDIPALEADPSLKLAGESNTNIRFIGLNLSREPFDNPLVRQAIAAVVDREAMLGPTVFGYGTPTGSPLPARFLGGAATGGAPAGRRASQSADGRGRTCRRVQHDHHLLVAVLVPVERGVVLQEQLRQIGIEAELNWSRTRRWSSRSTTHQRGITISP